jgi:hypothetical protein
MKMKMKMKLLIVICVMLGSLCFANISKADIIDYLFSCSVTDIYGYSTAPSVVKNAVFPAKAYVDRVSYQDNITENFNINPDGYNGYAFTPWFDLNSGYSIRTRMYNTGNSNQPISVFESPTGKTYKIWFVSKTWDQPIMASSEDLDYMMIVASLQFKYARVGDMNGDNKVDSADVPLFQAAYGGSGGTPFEADFDFDGDCDFSDYGVFWAAHANDNP